MITTEALVEKIKNDAPPIPIRCEALGIDTVRHVVEGDVGLSPDRLLPYAAERIALAKRVRADPEVKKQGLIAVEVDGKILRWRRGKVLDYCVYRPTFNSDEEYQRVVDDMRFATADWSAVCGIEFLYRPERDNDPDLQLGELTFPVIRQNGGGNTIAMAFFPNDPVDQRFVTCFDGYYSEPSSFDPVGVLRHELGHVLGFRHEHIRPEAPDFFNPEDTEHIHLLTDYDPQSVMHYVAQGVGDPALQLTDSDRAGAVQVYGAPDSDFTFVD